MTFFHFLVENRSELGALIAQHLFLVVVSTFAAALIGVPAGIIMTRIRRLEKPLLAVANVLQTIPSLALFGFLIPILGHFGIGALPALIALFLYALLPIMKNTFMGISGIDPAVREAAVGMGMTDRQLLFQVELPLSRGWILGGIRIATVISIGTATIAAAIGAGGLGTYIFRGLRMNDNILILAGAVPAAVMALAADFFLGLLEKTMGRRKKSSWKVPFAVALLFLAAAGFIYAKRFSNAPPAVIIGSKDFTEQVILGELLAQTIETETPLQVIRKFELGGDLTHRALLSGEIDGYVEYTGTAYTAILKHPPESDPKKVFDDVKKEYDSNLHAFWFPPLGFNNTFAILVRGADAERYHLRKISDLIPIASKLKAAFGQDFMSRKDGYAGFIRRYPMKFSSPPLEMDLSLTYRALLGGKVDLIAGNSTDGMIKKLDLVQLEDDRHFFPPYEAAPVFRETILNRYPQMKKALARLSGKISNSMMRKMNFEVDENHQSPHDVARAFLLTIR